MTADAQAASSAAPAQAVSSGPSAAPAPAVSSGPSAAPAPAVSSGPSVSSAPAGAARAARGAGARAVIAMGSNLGDRLDNLQGGLDALFDAPGFTFIAVSPVFETAPVGGPRQPAYLNAVLIAAATPPARAVLDRCHSVEAVFGRARTEVWGPRTLDLDLIIYGDEVSDDPELRLPHPRAHERAFVLAPWYAADPEATLPGHGRVADLLARVGLAGVSRLDGAVLHAPE